MICLVNLFSLKFISFRVFLIGVKHIITIYYDTFFYFLFYCHLQKILELNKQNQNKKKISSFTLFE